MGPIVRLVLCEVIYGSHVTLSDESRKQVDSDTGSNDTEGQKDGSS